MGYLTHQGVFHILLPIPGRIRRDPHRSPDSGRGVCAGCGGSAWPGCCTACFGCSSSLLFSHSPGARLFGGVCRRDRLFLLIEAVLLALLYPAARGAYQSGAAASPPERGVPLDHNTDWTRGRGVHRGNLRSAGRTDSLLRGQALRERLASQMVSLPEEGRAASPAGQRDRSLSPGASGGGHRLCRLQRQAGEGAACSLQSSFTPMSWEWRRTAPAKRAGCTSTPTWSALPSWP